MTRETWLALALALLAALAPLDVAPAEARAGLHRSDPSGPSHAAAQAAYSEYAALLIRAEVRLAEWRRGGRRAG